MVSKQVCFRVFILSKNLLVVLVPSICSFLAMGRALPFVEKILAISYPLAGTRSTQDCASSCDLSSHGSASDPDVLS